MPRVHKIKARKDYPNEGIKKGDFYSKTKFKTGPASGFVKRFKTEPTPSQLTQSPFKSAFLGAEEEWNRSDKDEEALRAAAEAIQELADECQNNFDNMPEALQMGDTGQMVETRANECERIASALEDLAGELEDLDEPEEYDDEPFDPSDYAEEMSEMDPEDVGEFLTGKEQEHDERISEAQEGHDHYHSEIARIQEEADSLLGEMPE